MFINTLCVLLIYAIHTSKINVLYIVKKVNFRRKKNYILILMSFLQFLLKYEEGGKY